MTLLTTYLAYLDPANDNGTAIPAAVIVIIAIILVLAAGVVIYSAATAAEASP
jgi:hypothetical protein